MREDKAKSKKVIFLSSQDGKITALILTIVILIVVILDATFVLSKPSPEAILTRATDTKIQAARVDVKTISSKSKIYSGCVAGPNSTIRVTVKSIPESDANSGL